MVGRKYLNHHAKPFVLKHHFFVDTIVGELHLSLFETLPDSVLILIFDQLSSLELCKVAAVSQRTRSIVVNFNIRDRIRSNRFTTVTGKSKGHLTDRYKTAKKSLERLSTPIQLLRMEGAARNRAAGRFSITQEATWHHKAMPVLKADASKMVLAVGNDLWSSCNSEAWTISRQGKPGIGDISDLAFTEVTDEIIVGFVDGRIERLRLGLNGESEHASVLLHCLRAQSRNSVEAIDYDTRSKGLLSVYLHGQLILNWSNINIGSRPWCTRYLIGGNKIATGTRSNTALKIHEAMPSGLQSVRNYATTESSPTSVFAIEPTSDNLLLSGWYDGATRLYDLRASSNQPVSCWRDPYGDAAIYSLATTDNAIYAGSAIDGVVHFFDFRNTNRGSGFSLFLGPKAERGPVYSLVSEHEAVYGATERSVMGANFYETRRYDKSGHGQLTCTNMGGCKCRSVLAHYLPLILG